MYKPMVLDINSDFLEALVIERCLLAAGRYQDFTNFFRFLVVQILQELSRLEGSGSWARLVRPLVGVVLRNTDSDRHNGLLVVDFCFRLVYVCSFGNLREGPSYSSVLLDRERC